MTLIAVTGEVRLSSLVLWFQRNAEDTGQGDRWTFLTDGSAATKTDDSEYELCNHGYKHEPSETTEG